MERLSLRWNAIVGALVMIFLISETSALVCYEFVFIEHLDSPDKIPSSISVLGENVTCPPDEQACVDAQLELRIVNHTVLVNYRGCSNITDSKGGREFTTSGDEYLAIQYNARYCSSDVCNLEKDTADVYHKPGWVKEMPEASNASHCYSGLSIHVPASTLEKVTCPRDTDRCYQGHGNVSAGHLTARLYISGCQNTCAIPPRQVFGPIVLNVPENRCCLGSYCNKKEDADSTQNNHTLGAPDGSDAEDAEDEYADYTNSDSAAGPALPTFFPRAHGPIHGNGAILQLSPLLVTLGTIVLGLWW